MSGRLRAARPPGDLPAVPAEFGEYVERLGLALAHQDVEGEIAALPGEDVPPRGAVLLAELDGRPVGMGALRPLPGSAEPRRIYLRPEAHGSGLGRHMAATLIGAARAAGSPLAPLNSERDFTAALALCGTLGFAETERCNDNPLPGPLFMALDLSPQDCRA